MLLFDTTNTKAQKWTVVFSKQNITTAAQSDMSITSKIKEFKVRNTIILVLDSITSVLNFLNWIKASFMENLGFPDIKSVPRRGERCGVQSPRAQSFNLFVLLTCTPNGWDKLRGYRKFKDKVGFMKVKEISQPILLQIFQSITFNLLLELIDTCAYN